MKRRSFIGFATMGLIGSTVGPVVANQSVAFNQSVTDNWLFILALDTHGGSYILPVKEDAKGFTFFVDRKTKIERDRDDAWAYLPMQVEDARKSYSDLSVEFDTIIVDHNATVSETVSLCNYCTHVTGHVYLHKAHPQLGDYGHLINYWEPRGDADLTRAGKKIPSLPAGMKINRQLIKS